MGLARVEKVEILAHASLRTTLLSLLQKAGIVHLEEVRREEAGLRELEADVSRLDHLLHRLKRCLDFLSRREKKKLLDKIKATKPALSSRQREELLSSDYLPVLERVEKIEAEQNEILSHVRFLEKEMDFLQPLADLDLPGSWFKGSDAVEVAVGTLPLALKEDLARLAGEDAVWFEVVRAEKRICYLLLFYLKKEKNRIEEKLSLLLFICLNPLSPVPGGTKG